MIHTLVLLCGVLVAQTSVETPGAESLEQIRSLDDIGFDATRRAKRVESYIDLPFATRADQILNRATFSLRFETAPPHDLDVAVNHESIGVIKASEVRAGEVEYRYDLDTLILSGTDTVTLRFLSKALDEAPEHCRFVEAGAWSSLAKGSIQTVTSLLPLPNDMSLFPLPFVDPRVSEPQTVALVLPAGQSVIRAAILLAGGLNRITGSEPHFDVYRDSLPTGHAVVVLTNERDAAALGLSYLPGARSYYTSNPKSEGHKLLVISGSGAEEAESAVLGTLLSEARSGPSLTPVLDAVTGAVEAAAGQVPPSWKAIEEPLTLSSFAEGDLVAKGGRTQTLSVGFRIPPDLFIWPATEVPFDVHFAQTTAMGQAPARIDVEFNGRFITTLPEVDGGERTVRLFLHRDTIRGYNSIDFHVRYPEAKSCIATRESDGAVTIFGDSILHFENTPRFAVLPDVDRFINDGYPFSRVGDLGETAVVLSSGWVNEEVETLLSVFAHLAAVTETLPTGIRVYTEDTLPKRLDLDLIAVGGLDSHRWIAQWSKKIPVTLGHRGAELAAPGIMDQLRGRVFRGDRERAEDLLGHEHSSLAAISGFVSPFAKDRSAILITSTGPNTLPHFTEFEGYAESRSPGGDLLILADGSRWRFRLGATSTWGSIHPWDHVRFWLSERWWLMPLGVLLCLVLLVPVLRDRLRRRAEGRLEFVGPEGVR
ncbi:MAG: cellulose biosynthesis cyclic di-GMP-binding regulatory protein BcsB [Myxococcota bacterium]